MRHEPSVQRSGALIIPGSFPHLSPSDENATTEDEMPMAFSETKAEKRRRALVVDDVIDVAEMLTVLLFNAGFDVVTVNSALAAIKAVRQYRFDFIVSDIGMPAMNGYELARVVRGLPGYEAVPMVAVTGYSEFDDREAALSAGFTAQMTKPIDPQSLLDLLEHLLSHDLVN